MKTFVIAEAGSNHNQSLGQAKKLIEIAKNSGASAVKFQTAKSELLYAKNTPDFAGYKSVNELIKKIELPRTWQKDLKHYCDDIGIEFMSTPFDEEAVEQLVNLDVKRIKIAGFESTDWRFVNMVASTGLPLIVSLGIGFKKEYCNILKEITDKYENELTVLHCNNAYPTPIQDINLKDIQLYQELGFDNVGLSDHTMSVLTPSIAVSLGAVAIEKHFTISRQLSGPDHPFALEPNELKIMIENIKQTEMMLKSSSEEYTESEKKFISARRSIVANKNLKKGEILTESNLTTLRPYLKNNIAASEYYNVLGKKTTRIIKKGEALFLDDVK